ncbi:MAG: hypothetical protein HOI53_01295 [Francisellaceae bacterium]|jgi:hypothetical protein|nr:hypothetical protein [Francisellaceae bacterium]MBT6206637.1 hypothetical protein [Francisellaceae bacterium]MBT6539464.1 hypothetical protein [Francisellaceae bacterium]
MNKKISIFKNLGLDYLVPRYDNISVYPLNVNPKLLVISSLPNSGGPNEAMFIGMLKVLKLAPHEMTIVRFKEHAEFALAWDELLKIIQVIVPVRLIYLQKDNELPYIENCQIIKHPINLATDMSLKRKVYNQLLELSKELSL